MEEQIKTHLERIEAELIAMATRKQAEMDEAFAHFGLMAAPDPNLVSELAYQLRAKLYSEEKGFDY